MAGEKLTQRTVTTTAADNDLMHIVDVSDTTDSPEGTSKQITKANFASDITPSASQILTAIKTVDGAGSGLDADTLDGQHGSYFYPANNPNGYTNDQTPSEILTAIKTVDGSGSGLDADLLDGKQGADFMDLSATPQTKTGAIGARYYEANILASNVATDLDQTRIDGYGIMTNRATSVYFTNAAIGGSVRIGNGGIHNANNIAIFSSTGLAVTGVITATGNITATAFFENSDERLKTNLKDYQPKEIKVNWKEYQLKNAPLIDRIGVSAQELLKTNPKFVNTDDDNSYTVNYIDLLCAKMAEKDEQIARLEAKVDLLIKELL